MVRLTLVANPGSGRDTDLTALAAALRERGADVEAFDIDEIGDAARAVGATDRLVVAGGDGSIGLAARAAARAGVPLAVVPTGTANDFARALDLPTDREAALDLAADPDAPTSRIELLIAGRPPVRERRLDRAGRRGRAPRPAAEVALRPARLRDRRAARGAHRASRSRSRSTPTASQMYAGEAWHVIVGGTGAFGGGSRLGRTDHERRAARRRARRARLAPRPHPARLGHAPRDPRGAARRPAPARAPRGDRRGRRARSSTSTARSASCARPRSPRCRAASGWWCRDEQALAGGDRRRGSRRGTRASRCAIAASRATATPSTARRSTVGTPEFLRACEELTAAAATEGSHAEVLVNGDAIFPAYLETIRQARVDDQLPHLRVLAGRHRTRGRPGARATVPATASTSTSCSTRSARRRWSATCSTTCATRA